MAAGDATAADVPARYDLVLNGKGYVFDDAVESSIPFRTHRAIYDITQTFVERQNVSGSYGDETQDFFQTATQNDWSLGEQQKFFRPNDAEGKRRFWRGGSIDVRVPGQVTMRPGLAALTLASNPRAAIGGSGSGGVLYVLAGSNGYTIDTTGAITDIGAHGASSASSIFAECITWDPVGIIFWTDGSVVRKWVPGSGFSSFSASGASALVSNNNTLYGLTTGGALVQWDTSGTRSVVFQWKDDTGTNGYQTAGMMRRFGGKIVFLWKGGQSDGGEIWQYDGVGPSLLETFDANFLANRLEIVEGIVFVAGAFRRAKVGGGTEYKPAIRFLASGTPGLLWQADDYSSSSYTPAMSTFDGGLIFHDTSTNRIMQYTPSTGGVHAVGAWTPAAAGAQDPFAAGGGVQFGFFSAGGTSAAFYPSNTSFATSATVDSSLIDLDSSLTKIFRGIKIDWEPGSGGDGGSVDIAYQVDSVAGSYTTLQTGAVSGTEYILSSVSGHSISVRITLNKGTSTSGPTLKRVYLRAAPQLQQFRSGIYILNLTGTEAQPQELRDTTMHALTGFDQATNLFAAARLTAPFSVTDRFGTFTALIDLSDPEGFDIYEVHPDTSDVKKPGSYLARIKVREV